MQRSDDTKEKIKVRYREFLEHIDSIMTMYVEKGVLLNGSKSPTEIQKRIFSLLDDIKQQKLSSTWPATR